jgi:hypothetical protein
MKIKPVISVVDDPKAAEAAEADYWRSLTPEQRLIGLEEIHAHLWQMKHGNKEGFHRVHRIIAIREG